MNELKRNRPDPLAVLSDATPAQLAPVRADVASGMSAAWALASRRASSC